MTEHETALAEGDEAEQHGDLRGASRRIGSLSTSDVPDRRGAGTLPARPRGVAAGPPGRCARALRARARIGDRARRRRPSRRDRERRGLGVLPARDLHAGARIVRGGVGARGERELRGRIQINIGALALLLGDVEEARESYERAVELLDSINDEEALTLALHNLALAHAEEQDWDAAESVVRALSGDRREARRQECDGGRDAESGGAALRGRALSRGDERSEKSLAIFAELEDESGRAAALRVQGEIYRKMHQLEEAEPRLKEAIRIAGRLQLLTLEAEAARELGMVKAGRGDVTSATKWLRRALARFSLMSADDQMHAIEEQLQALKPWRPSGEQKTVKKA